MSTPSAYVVTLSTAIRYISLSINFATLIIGTFGGVCNLITFTSPRLRGNSFVFYLLCATAFQLLSILFVVPTRMALDNFDSNLERESVIFCKVRFYLVITLPELATYYILLSIMDRCLATSTSANMRAWSQLKMAHRLSAGVLIVIVVSNAHSLVFYTIFNNNCQSAPDTVYTLFLAGYILAVVIILPHLLMLILSVITFFNVKRTRKRVVPVSNIVNQRQTHRFESHIIMVIVLQVVVSSVLLLLRIGSYLYSVFTSGNLNKTPEERVAEGFALQLGVSLYYFSFAIAFFVSTLTRKYFREILWKRIGGFLRHFHRQV